MVEVLTGIDVMGDQECVDWSFQALGIFWEVYCCFLAALNLFG